MTNSETKEILAKEKQEAAASAELTKPGPVLRRLWIFLKQKMKSHCLRICRV